VADFRDPMVQEGQPASRLNQIVHQRLEKAIVRHSSCCTLVSRSALDAIAQRYPDKKTASWQLIENGYDESLFEPYDHLSDSDIERPADRPVKILHSGILYSSGRNPLPFLEAIKSLIDKSKITVEVVFRGCGNEEEVGEYINRLNLANVVKLLPSITYDEAIKEMIQSDVLAVFQGSVYNNQIPAKIYEYIRAERPILALTDEAGETARMLRDWDGIYVANIESKESIEDSISKVFDDLKSNKFTPRDRDEIEKLSRYAGTEKLSDLLFSVAGFNAPVNEPGMTVD